MASATVRIGNVSGTYIVPVGDLNGTLYTAVQLYGDDASLHLSTADPRTVERGRMVVASLTAALDALEDAIQKKNAVPIASLAPDAVSADEAA